MAKVITLCGAYHFPTKEDRENFAKNISLSSQFDFITFRYVPGYELPYVVEYFDINHGETYGESEEDWKIKKPAPLGTEIIRGLW